MDHDTDLVDGHYIEMDLRNKTTSEFRTVFDSPLGVPNSQVPLYIELVTVQVLHHECTQSQAVWVVYKREDTYDILFYGSRK